MGIKLLKADNIQQKLFISTYLCDHSAFIPDCAEKRSVICLLGTVLVPGSGDRLVDGTAGGALDTGLDEGVGPVLLNADCNI